MAEGLEFTPQDFEMAPQYWSPVRSMPIVALEFPTLQAMAREQEANGMFRTTPDGTLGKAPVFVDNLPAAFYKIDTKYPKFTPEYTFTEPETLIVLQGALKVVSHDPRLEGATSEGIEGAIPRGQLIELRDITVAMQAVEFPNLDSCLAVSLYQDASLRV